MQTNTHAHNLPYVISVNNDPFFFFFFWQVCLLLYQTQNQPLIYLWNQWHSVRMNPEWWGLCDFVSVSQSVSVKMAAADTVVTVNVDDVTVDSSGTEDEAVKKPAVRFSDQVEEDGTDGASKANGGHKENETSPGQGHSQQNGPTTSSAADAGSTSSPRRQRTRRDDTPLLDQQVVYLAFVTFLLLTLYRCFSC